MMKKKFNHNLSLIYVVLGCIIKAPAKKARVG